MTCNKNHQLTLSYLPKYHFIVQTVLKIAGNIQAQIFFSSQALLTAFLSGSVALFSTATAAQIFVVWINNSSSRGSKLAQRIQLPNHSGAKHIEEPSLVIRDYYVLIITDKLSTHLAYIDIRILQISKLCQKSPKSQNDLERRQSRYLLVHCRDRLWTRKGWEEDQIYPVSFQCWLHRLQ